MSQVPRPSRAPADLRLRQPSETVQNSQDRPLTWRRRAGGPPRSWFAGVPHRSRWRARRLGRRRGRAAGLAAAQAPQPAPNREGAGAGATGGRALTALLPRVLVVQTGVAGVVPVTPCPT